MNFIVENWYLFILALVSGSMLLLPVVKGAGGGTLTVQNAVQLINRQKAVVVDVSEPDEFAAGHVNGAKNVPLAQLEERLPVVARNKALPVVLVCAKGARAQRAASQAKKMGYEQAQALAGGLAAWREANMPIEKSQETATAKG
ncbi:MAG: rhodanese-like domain-containing protein [Acidovorax sp.]